MFGLLMLWLHLSILSNASSKQAVNLLMSAVAVDGGR